jgi:hypothetical protein
MISPFLKMAVYLTLVLGIMVTPYPFPMTGMRSLPPLHTGEGRDVWLATQRGTTGPVRLAAAGIAPIRPDLTPSWHIKIDALEMTKRFGTILWVKIAHNLIIALFAGSAAE